MSRVNAYLIIDESGSMFGQIDSTKSGVEEYLDTLIADKDNQYNIDMTIFSDESSILCRDVSPTYAKELFKSRGYNPHGLTALYDAIGLTIGDYDSVSIPKSTGVYRYVQDVETGERYYANRVEVSKNLCIVVTDGGENRSRRFNAENIKNLIRDLEAKGNWTFVYLGANADAWNWASGIGVHKGNFYNYNLNDTRLVYRAAAGSTRSYAGYDALAVNDFGEQVASAVEGDSSS